MSDNRRVWILIVTGLVILGVFLTFSRAPALDEKALMGARTDISGIAFDQLVVVSQTDGVIERVVRNSINWAYTNWKGMTFGLLFGATVLTLLRALPLWSFSANRFVATLQGLIGGAPLGVCVNCATPVAQGMNRAGARTETMLALMMSSPTLNFIVVTMMLSLFDPYFVLLKLCLTLVFVLVLVPVVVLAAGGRGPEPVLPVTAAPAPDQPQSWGVTFQSVISDLLGNLWFLVRISVPLMLLAGVLGSVVMELVTFDELEQLQAAAHPQPRSGGTR